MVSCSGCDRLERVPLPWGWGGGLKGKRNGNYRHGLFTAEAMKMRRTISALIRASRHSLADLSVKHR